jgi:hypothetical protein
MIYNIEHYIETHKQYIESHKHILLIKLYGILFFLILIYLVLCNIFNKSYNLKGEYIQPIKTYRN